MKTSFTFLLLTFLAVSLNYVQAQDVSKMLTQVTEGIKPEAFKKKFLKNKEDWTNQVSSATASNLPGVTKQVGSLVKGLKGSAFAAGAKKELIKKLGSINNLSDIGSLLSSLVKGISPAMLTDSFASNKDTLMKGLEQLN